MNVRAVLAAALAGMLLATPGRVHAQTAPAQGSGMPDPRAMSGIPLQVPDLPVGTVTARVIRGALTNPLKGETVELIGPSPARAQTDESGRATFTALAPGTRVKAVVVVDGERIESGEFQVPAAGGTRVMLVAGATGESTAAPLAKEPAVRGTVVLGDQSRFVLELGDDALNVFNIVQIVNATPRPVDAGGPLVFELPAESVGAGMLEGSAPNAVAAGKKVTVTGPFAPGNTIVQFAYSLPLGSEQIVVAQKMPAQLTRLTVIAQKIGGMQLASPQVTQRREMAADGQTYIVAEGGAVQAGETVTLTLSALPHRASWPRNVALAIAAVVLGAGAWAAARRLPPAHASRTQQMQTRRDELFAQLTALEEDRRAGRTDAAAYSTRREQLVTALEELYAGLEREPAVET